MTGISDDLEGITTPLVTPFDDGDIDWAAYDDLLKHVVDGGVDGVFPCGTTGEFASLTPRERRQTVERAVESTPDDVAVVAGGTGTAVADTVDWIETAADLGVDGVVVTAPYFHTSNSPDGLRRFFHAVADASPVPLLLYNIPACVGETVPADVVADVAANDTVVGLKDSSGDLAYGLRVGSHTPEEFCLLQGSDALLLPALRSGFDGGVNALSNVVPEVYADIVAEPEAERALALHREVVEPLFDLCLEEGFAAAAKAGLTERGVLPSNEVRPPLVSVEDDRTRALLERVEADPR